MYIPKRWIAPMVLSMILLLAILVTILTNMRFEQPRSAPPEKVELAAATMPMQDPVNPSCVPSAEQQAFNQFLMTLPPPGTGGPVGGSIGGEAVGNNSPNSQFSAGSWGDIGQQWRDVQVGAPVTNNHISNEGNNNTNNVVNGNNNVTASPQTVNINITPPTPPVTDLVVEKPAVVPATTVAPVTTVPATTPPTTVAPVTTIAP